MNVINKVKALAKEKRLHDSRLLGQVYNCFVKIKTKDVPTVVYQMSSKLKIDCQKVNQAGILFYSIINSSNQFMIH